MRTDKLRGKAQGGILSPVSYNLFAANLPDYIKSDIFQFADDIVLVKQITILRNDILAINQYCSNNELKLKITYRFGEILFVENRFGENLFGEKPIRRKPT